MLILSFKTSGPVISEHVFDERIRFPEETFFRTHHRCSTSLKCDQLDYISALLLIIK